MNQKTVLIVVAIVALLIGSILWNVDWDARALNQRMQTMIELVELDGAESKFESLGRSRKVTALFTDDCEIEYLPQRHTLMGTDSIAAAYLSVRNMVEKASVRQSRHRVTIADDGLSAESAVTVKARVESKGGDSWSDSLEYRIFWQKLDGEWLVDRILLVSGGGG